MEEIYYQKSVDKAKFLLLFLAFLMIGILILPGKILAQTDALLPSKELKNLTIEELMDIEVTSVSKRLEKLVEAASAIQVITQEDIHSSGAKTLTEALRLAPNLQTAQVNSSQWAISARGFNNVLANKLLVLVDGRSVYTPLYAGVFWDVQNFVLEDIERIEVISGPGGTLWGANAVNGVINIITKSTKNTQGLLVEGAIGSNMPGLGNLRYGGRLSDKLSYRIYGTGFKMGSTIDSNKVRTKDHWSMLQGGLQVDWDASEKDKITFQQNGYTGKPNPDGTDTTRNDARGSNIAVRWDHKTSEKSDFQLQAYYDHTWRDFNNGFTEDLKTYDLDGHSQHQLGKRHTLSYGMGLRISNHQVTNLELFKFLPEHKTLSLYNVFAQDEIMLINNQLRFTIGAKLEHNSYTGFEYQPNLRLTWMPAKNHTLWTAVSRAVRTPARIDRDFSLYLIPDLALIAGSDSLVSEEMLAYELGWRTQPLENLSISLSAFHNIYDNIRSSEPGPPPFNIPITFGNGVEGKTYGVELAATYRPADWCNLRGGYTFLKKDLLVKPDSRDLNGGTAESNDPAHQFLIQSTINLPGRVELGTVIRYVDNLPQPYVPDYVGLDVRVGWRLNEMLELSVVGQNLLDSHHPEFIPSSPSPRQIENSIFGKITWRY